jgi:hypothetical protein
MLKALNVADSEGHTKHNPNGSLDQLPVVVKILISKIPTFCLYLRKLPAERQYVAQNKQRIEAFGWHRYNILNLIHSLLALKYSAVTSELIKTNVFPIIVDLLFKFEHNSFCHNLVFRIAISMLEQFDAEIVEEFIRKTDLPVKILDAERTFKSGSAKITRRKEYMPMLYKIAEQLARLMDRFSYFKKYLRKRDSEWNTLVSNLAAEQKKLKESEIIPDRNAPRGKVVVEDEEGFKPQQQQQQQSQPQQQFPVVESRKPVQKKLPSAENLENLESLDSPGSSLDSPGSRDAPVGEDAQNVISAIDAILNGSFDDIVNDKTRLKELTLNDFT